MKYVNVRYDLLYPVLSRVLLWFVLLFGMEQRWPVRNSVIGSNALICCDRHSWSLDDLFT